MVAGGDRGYALRRNIWKIVQSEMLRCKLWIDSVSKEFKNIDYIESSDVAYKLLK